MLLHVAGPPGPTLTAPVGAAGSEADLQEVRRALALTLGPGAEPVGRVIRTTLDYDTFQAGRQVCRLSGDALVAGRRRAWSLVEKVTSPPGVASEDLRALAERELLAHRSGLLADHGPGLRAAAAAGTLDRPDGSVVLLTEDLGPRQRWSASRFVAAARDLGRFNGRWLGRAAPAPWLFRGWAQRHSQPQAVEDGRRVLEERFGAAHVVLGDVDVSKAWALLDDQPRFADIFDALPVTLCHHDAVQSNLFWTAGRTVAIDWELVGPGPVGADLASLLFSSGRRGDLPVDWLPELRSRATSSYCAGLAEVGGAVTEAEVRRGFDAAVSLRWSLLRDVVLMASTDGPGQVRGSRPDEPRTESIRQLALLTRFLLDAAERVRRVS